MPTPVSVARQCLTDEAARALDDAVAVARRRGHAQTTSLHIVSALLALPNSTLREACSRARSSAFSPRVQFRALELSVGVSLDRLPSSKTLEEPPVSNSLMAAIKRSQANQRRHPESFHLHQIHTQQQTTSVLKVELKHFVLSILDDPNVSRVFAEAGFNSNNIKLVILQPPVSQASRFSRIRCPPIFLGNLADLDPGRRSFGFPFAGNEDGDANSRRIGEVLVRRSGKNPLLVGVCSSEALRGFIDGVESGKVGVLPGELAGLKVVCFKNEISEFVVEVGREEKMSLKLKEVGHMAEQCSGSGIILNIGELKVLVGDGVIEDRVSFVVSQFKSLLEIRGGKLWLIGAAETNEIYFKFLARFPSIEKDWDLHLLPITSIKASTEGLYPKSSLLGSFVPFGGFFIPPSDLKNPVSITQESTHRHLCNKYEQEVTSFLKDGSTCSVAGRHPESLPSWLQTAEYDKSKGLDVTQTKDDDGTLCSGTTLALQKKWNEICQRTHHTQSCSKIDTCQLESQVTSAKGLLIAADRKEHNSEDSSPHDNRSSFSSSCVPKNMPTNFPVIQDMAMLVTSQTENVICQPELSEKVSKSWQTKKESSCISPYPNHSVNFLEPTPHSSVTSITTDLGLGTIYASTSKEPKCPILNYQKERQLHFSGSFGAKFDGVSENNPHQVVQSSFSPASNFERHCDPIDFKSLKGVLTEKVWWQDEAICTITQALCCGRSGNSNLRRGIWLTLLGPDKVGKKKIALALAESLHGNNASLVSVDLCSHDRVFPQNSIFEHQELYDLKFRGKTIVDYLAGELSRKPRSVVFLENVDTADFLVQSSLSQAIRTGKFPDSHGRDISINNIIFVATSNISKGNNSHHLEKDFIKYPEEVILSAKRCQVQLEIHSISMDAKYGQDRTVRVEPREGTTISLPVNKRKVIGTIVSKENFEMQKRRHKMSTSYLDLNLPVEEMEENNEYEDHDSDSMSENSEAWLEDFFNQVDEKVIMKPFDFDALAEKVMEIIDHHFKRILGSEATLEIDYKVMVQILAATWLSNSKRAMADWIEQVLCRGFAEARQKYSSTACCVKLIAIGALALEEQAHSICLPARISLN